MRSARTRRCRLAIATVVLLCACGARATTPAEDLASAVPVMDQVDADWLGDMQAGDAERLAAPYATDAVFVTPTGRVVVGREAIAGLYRAGFSQGSKVLRGGIHRDGAQSAGYGLVYEWGHGGATRREADGREVAHEGAYLTVWRRDAAGTWKIVRNMAF
jgi:uncharacterized protein (TIGR02246 family)